MNVQARNYINAGCSGLCIVSHEETRVEADMQQTAAALGYGFYVWSLTEGISHVLAADKVESIADTQEPFSMLDTFAKLPAKSVLLARDFHAVLGNGQHPADPMLVRKLRDTLAIGRGSNRVLVLLGCQLRLPPEIEKEIVILDFRLPDRAVLTAVLRDVAECAGLKLKGDEVDPLLDAASGLTTLEAENAFAISYAETKAIKPAIVHREKSAAVKKNGILEIVESGIGLADIGGLQNLKRDLHEKRNLFSKAAKDFGLPTPRGKLVVGQAGTGKSLTASATANIFGLPLIRLEAGRLFGSYVGQSEANWRAAYETVKAVAPCVLWIDEVDGLFAGGAGGSTDGGTTQRVLKAILQDMQFNGEGVFFMFTANDVDRLPDPLIDRLDVWSVDLPTANERAEIWRIHIAKRKRDPKQFDLPALAALTEGFSGRQIEQAWLKAMSLAFNDEMREPGMKDCEEACSRMTATSKTMAGEIEARRKRLEGRAQPASAPEERQLAVTVASKTRRLAQ